MCMCREQEMPLPSQQVRLVSMCVHREPAICSQSTVLRLELSGVEEKEIQSICQGEHFPKMDGA